MRDLPFSIVSELPLRILSTPLKSVGIERRFDATTAVIADMHRNASLTWDCAHGFFTSISSNAENQNISSGKICLRSALIALLISDLFTISEWNTSHQSVNLHYKIPPYFIAVKENTGYDVLGSSQHIML